MKQVSIYVPENAAMEAVTPAYRLFNTANEFLQSRGKRPLFKVEYVATKKNVEVSDGAYTIRIDRLLKDINATDLLVIPAIYGDVETAIAVNEKAIPWMQQMYAKGCEISSLCIGSFLLAETGLLDGKKCSTHWASYDQMRQRYPTVEIVDGSVITDEGRIYSSGGANSCWNLLLYLLEKYTDRDTAVLASKYFAIDIDRNSQAAFTIFTGQKDHHDKEVLAAQEMIERTYAERMTVDELADKVNVSRRSFERRFKFATNNTPVEYMQRVRIEAAKRHFEGTNKNVAEVMYDVGYTDTKAFREVFKKITGLTPIEYRNKYSKMVVEADVDL